MDHATRVLRALKPESKGEIAVITLALIALTVVVIIGVVQGHRQKQKDAEEMAALYCYAHLPADVSTAEAEACLKHYTEVFSR